MPPLTVDGIVHPEEYEVRVDDKAHKIQVHPTTAPIFMELYYSFDGSALHFGIRRTQAVKVRGISIWIDPDRNGCEVGDLLIAAAPEHRLVNYGVFDTPGTTTPVAGHPPDPGRAGVEVKCFEDGDTEVKITLAKQYANGFTPNPLPDKINVNVSVKAELNGKNVVNYVRDVPIQTFVIAFE